MRVTVRSEALAATAARVSALADQLREDAALLAGAVAGLGPPRRRAPGDVLALGSWLRLEGEAVGVVGPGGVWGEALSLDALAAGLRASARVYTEVELGVSGVLAGVAAGADLVGRGGWLVDSWGGAPDGVGRGPVLRPVAPTPDGPLVGEAGRAGRVPGVADLVAAGEGLGGGRVRVIETTRGDGGSAWVVVVPGTQEWSPRAGSNPFDLTTDVRALTAGATVAAAGVAAALALARARSGRATPGDPVMLVGHSQGGVLAAALASDPGFRREHRVTHVVTSGSPVALFPVPESVRVLSVEHLDDPVPRLDLSPVPTRSSWVCVRAPALGPPVDVRRHALDAYVRTVRTVEDAPRGTVAGLDGWRATSGAFVGVPVVGVTDVVVGRSRPPGGDS